MGEFLAKRRKMRKMDLVFNTRNVRSVDMGGPITAGRQNGQRCH